MSTKDLSTFFNSSKTTKTKSKSKTPTPPRSDEPTPTFQIPIPTEPDTIDHQAFKILVQKTKLKHENQLPDHLKPIISTGQIETILQHETLPTINLSLSHLEFILPKLDDNHQTLLKRFISRYKKTDIHLLFTYFRIDEMLDIFDNIRGSSPQIKELKSQIETAHTLYKIGIKTPKDLSQIRSTLLSHE